MLVVSFSIPARVHDVPVLSSFMVDVLDTRPLDGFMIMQDIA
jgi:hypothetical protein